MNMLIFIKKAFCIAGACLMAVGAITLNACSDTESENNPTQPSNGNENQESLLHDSYPISVNQENSEFTMNFHLDETGCILQDEKLNWETKRLYYETIFYYSLDNGTLILENDEIFFPTLWGPKNANLFGVWHSIDKDGIVNEDVDYVITSDSLVIKQTKFIPTAEEVLDKPVETPITLRTSYFMFDLYRCITEEHFCQFSQWHFSKRQGPNAEDMVYIYKISILEETSNSIRFKSEDRDISVNVLHVQDDSLNNGRGYYSAYVTYQQDTCFFETLKSPVTKELCKEENMKYFLGYTVGGEDDFDEDEDDEDDIRNVKNENKDYADSEVYTVLYYMFKSNGEEFAKCVDHMINGAKLQ